jgi:thioredoxin-dependent peroxiredoxin
VIADFKKLDAQILGVSMDTAESHREFAKAHAIHFPLLPDPEGAIAAKYGVSTSRGFAERVTFIIDKNGTIAKVFPHVKVAGHAQEVLDAVKALPN